MEPFFSNLQATSQIINMKINMKIVSKYENYYKYAEILVVTVAIKINI